MAIDTKLSQTLYDHLGSEQLLEELTKALTQDEYDGCMQYIARMHDIEIPSEDEMDDIYNTYMREDERQTAHELVN